MKSLSDTVVASWNIAAAEAVNAGLKFIKKEHILISLTEIGKLIEPTAKKLNFTQNQIKSVRKEEKVINQIFLSAKINKTVLRRNLRSVLGTGRAVLEGINIKRDSECKKIFSKASSFTSNFRSANAVDILKAVMLSAGENITSLLKEQKARPKDLLSIIEETGESPKISLAGIKKDIKGKTTLENTSVNLFFEYTKNYIQKKHKLPPMFIFTGPNGAGKTTAAKILAKHISFNKCRPILFDMKQFGNTYRIKKLVGYGNEKSLLKKSLIKDYFQTFIFENIENCPAGFYYELLKFLNKNSAFFSNSMFIFTASCPYSVWSKTANLNFAALERKFTKELSVFAPQSFLKKNKIIIFKPLGKREAAKLIQDRIEEKKAEMFSNFEVSLHITKQQEKALIAYGLKEACGIRGLEVVFEDIFVSALTKYIERRVFETSKNWHFNLQNEKGVFDCR